MPCKKSIIALSKEYKNNVKNGTFSPEIKREQKKKSSHIVCAFRFGWYWYWICLTFTLAWMSGSIVLCVRNILHVYYKRYPCISVYDNVCNFDGLLMTIHLKHVRLCIHASFHWIFFLPFFSVNFDDNVYNTYVALLKTFGTHFFAQCSV